VAEPPWPHCLFEFFTQRWSSSSSSSSPSSSSNNSFFFILFFQFFIQLEICCTIKRASRRFHVVASTSIPRSKPSQDNNKLSYLLSVLRFFFFQLLSSSFLSILSILWHEKFHWNWFLLWACFDGFFGRYKLYAANGACGTCPYLYLSLLLCLCICLYLRLCLCVGS